jgi:serine phosphatase RsbU (regulator of sigma subunit)
MGHSVSSALLATLVVGALRNTRRRGGTLIDQANSAHEALLEHGRPRGGFVTGQLVRFDLVAQTAHIVNAGHPRPFRLRDGRAEEIMLAPEQPFGALPGSSWTTQDLPLRPGDRLLFLTDGMLERGARNLDIPAHLRDSAHLHPREAIQTITHAVLAAVGGKLEDDATSLCIDWHGGAQGDRVAHAGAEHRVQRGQT